ncbi:GTP pyrophosphokinase family protein [Mesobacillus maritimus]|uniref:GTP pyrophosphokinase n=1 Tax=Mesobacillus maritimus TaxID=1643336 RepID=UPI0020400399|nr:GTP pyrophosphokinase family protein [Mesobacillus maritimus]MCM3668053.1 GTP pyrophosphokinase family protein [Mesobacillus maritimus]
MDTVKNVRLTDMKALKVELTRFMMAYKFALDEMNTKINILKEEFNYIHDYNPIEHVKSRVKSPESILKKVVRKNLDLNMQSIRENIKDIAGVRITCSFESDIYKIQDMLQNQKDINVLECKDYIKSPKPNGYRSLHLILEIPVFLSSGEELIPVEIQIRTIAMDFWASLEHKIYYKYNKEVPEHLLTELKDAATAAAGLDAKMERINKEINVFKENDSMNEEALLINVNEEHMALPLRLLESIGHAKTETNH